MIVQQSSGIYMVLFMFSLYEQMIFNASTNLESVIFTFFDYIVVGVAVGLESMKFIVKGAGKKYS